MKCALIEGFLIPGVLLPGFLHALKVPLPREEAKEAAASGLPGARHCLCAQLPPALIVFTDLDRRRYKSNQD